MIETEPTPRAAEPGHDLVGNDQHAVAATHFGDRLPVAIRRHGRREGGAHNRFRDERGNGSGAGDDDGALEFICQFFSIAEGIGSGQARPVWIRR